MHRLSHLASFSGDDLLLDSWFGAGMFRVMMGVAKIEIPQINGERQRGLQYPDGIVAVNREVHQGQKGSQSAAFPKSNGNHALPRTFGRNPLNQESEPENKAAGKADDFPGIPGDTE